MNPNLSPSCRLVALVLSMALAGAAHAAGPKSPPPVKDISGIPDVGRAGLAVFPKMTCAMTKTLPKAAARHVSFKLEFGPGKVQQIRFDDPLDWSEEAKPLADKVVAWANDAQEYMACLRTWRNEFITALNPVIGYFNTAQDATASNRHPDLELLESPLRDRGSPFAFTCRLPEPLVGEPSALELATFDNCVQRHLDSHDRFIEARKKELADTTRRAAERVQKVE